MNLKKLFTRKKNHRRAPRPNAFVVESLEPRLLLSAAPVTAAVVTTDHVDYAPTETAVITTSNQAGDGLQFAAGELVQFQVSRTDGIADAAGTTADVGPTGKAPWYVIDGVGGFTAHLGSDVSGDGVADWIAPDNDLIVNSSISTTWYVEEQYRNSSLVVTSTGQASGAVATQAFTDAAINTTTTVSSSAATSTYGDAVTFTATVTPATGTVRPAGSVQFFDGTTLLGVANSATPGAGVTSTFSITRSSVDLTQLKAGSHSIHAVFLGATVGADTFQNSTSANITQTVNQKALVGSFGAGNRTYDGTTAATVLFTDLGIGTIVGSDLVDLTGGNATFDTKDAGLNKVVTLVGATLTGADASNYSLTAVSATTADIDKAIATVTVTGFNGTFDGLPHGATGTVIGVDAGGAALGSSLNLGATFTNVPGGTANWTFLGGINYTDQSGSVAIVINVAAVVTTTTVSSSTATSTYGNAVTFTATVSAASGIPTGTVSFFDGATLLGTDSAVDSTGVGTATWSFTTSSLTAGAHAIHAVFTGTPGSFNNSTSADITQTVNQKSLTGNFTVANRAYDATTTAVVQTRTLTGVLAGDAANVDLTGGVATFDTANVGVGKTVTLTGATLTGTASGNYSLTSVNTTTANIDKAIATVTVTGFNGTFDGLPHGATGTVIGVDAGGAALGSSLDLGATFTNVPGGTANWTFLGGINYTDQSGSVAIVINVPAVATTTTVSSSAATSTYGDAVTFTATVSAASGIPTGTVSFFDGATLLGTDSAVDSTGVGTATWSFTTSSLTAGTHAIHAVFTGTPGSFNNSTSADITQTVNQKSLTGNFTVANRAYDATTTAVVQTRTLTGVIGADVVTLTGGTAAYNNANVGTGKVVTLTGATLAGAAAGNYSLTSVNTTTANITALGITGNFTVTASKVYDGTTTAVVQTRTLTGVIGADAVSLIGGTAAYNNANVGTGKVVTLTGATLAGAAAGNYSLTSVNTTTANITALGITGNFTVANKVYDGTTTAVVQTRTLTGVIGADAVSLIGGTAAYNNANVGTGKVVTLTGATLAGAAAGNYSLTSVNTTTANITALGITGNFTVTASKVYDGTTTATVNAGSLTLTGVLAGDAANVSLTGGTANFADKNVGTGKVVTLAGASLTGAAAGNYSLTSVNTTTANITALGITGNFTVANKVYDGNTSATVLTRTLTGVIGADAVTLTGGTATFDTANVGTGKVVTLAGVTLTGAAAGNYSLTSVNTTTANITALGITGNFTVANKVYDGTTTATVNAGSLTLTGVLAGDAANVSLIGGTANFADKNVGTGKVVTLTGATLTGTAAGNYSLTLPVTTTANITALGITGNFTVANKVYDGNTSATVLIRTLTGVIGADAVTLTGGTATFDTANVGTGKVVTLAGATLTGTAAGNYSLTSVNTTPANITALGITGNFTVANKVYDGNTSATVLTRTLTGVIGADAVTLTGGTATFDTANVGTGKVVTLTGVTLTGTAAGNYSLTSVNTTTANITALGITGNLTVGNKVYDGTTTAAVNAGSQTLTGVLGTDVVTLTGGIATFDTANVGTGKVVTLTGATLAGTAAGNYSLTSVNTTTADITALGITGSLTVANKIYDGTTTAVVQTRTLTGVIGADAVSLTGGTATFDTANVGTGKVVTLAGATLAGTAAGNYSLTSVNTTTANITQATATITVTGYVVRYDGASHTATGTATGVNGEDLSVGLNLSGTTHSNVGSGVYRDTVTFTDATGNYRNATKFVANYFSRATATITVTSYAVTYNGAAHTATGTATGVLGEDLSAGLNLSGTTHSNVGPGIYHDTVTFTDTTGNYRNTTKFVKDYISRATATITVTGYAVKFNGAAHTATGTATGVLGEDLSAGLNLSGTTHTNVGPGIYHDTVTFTDPTGNYRNATKFVKDYVSRATATITVTGYAVTYNGAAHTATATAIGVNGEDLSAGLNLSGTTHTNVGPGIYHDTVTFTDATGNYRNATKFVKDYISKATATITVTGYAVHFDGTAHTATGTATGVGGVDLSAGLNLSGTTHSNSGTYIDTVTFTDAAGNYKNVTKFVKNFIV